MTGICKQKIKPGIILLICLVILVLVLIFTCKPILRQFAYYLDVNQTPGKSDVLFILGGGTGAREELGAKLYQQGLAPTVITSGEEVLLPGIQRTFAQISADYLVVLGVPLDAIILFTTTTSTRDEAQQCLDLIRQNGWTSVTVVTDSFHTRRTWLVFRQIFRNTGIEVTLVASNSSWYQPDHWWNDERSLLAIVGEYQKLAYYLVKGYIF
ncbi:MAG: YdcF family protein [Anaerolineae bacterium]